MLTAIDEPANQMMTLPMSVQGARQALKHFQDEYIQSMFEVFALMTPLAPWTAIIVAQLYTAEDKTYSGVAALDMFDEWNQAQEKEVGRWTN